MSDPAPALCGYCRSSYSEPLFGCTDTMSNVWGWRACHDCGAVFLSPRPTPAQLAEAYGTAYYGVRESKFGYFSEGFVELYRRSRARRLCRGLPPNARILDVGCGNGGFLAALHRLGDHHLHGTELPGRSAERAARRGIIELKLGELTVGDFPDDSLDLVTLFHVFEHLAEPKATLAAIHQALKPGGRLVMSFPNSGSNQARFFRGDWLHLDPPRHLFLFAPGPFRHAMKTAGFSVVAERHFSPEQNPYAFAQSLLNRLLQPRNILYERLKGNTTYAPDHGRFSLTAQAVAALALAPLAVGLDVLDCLQHRGATVEYTLVKIPR